MNRIVNTEKLSLTAHQTRTRDVSRYDLATGYPRFPLPPELVEIVIETTRECLQPIGEHGQLPTDRRLEEDVDQLMKSILGVPKSCGERARATLSGSIALDRSLCTAKLLAQATGSASICLMTGQPCLDIGIAIAEMHYGLGSTVLLGSASSQSARANRLVCQMTATAESAPSHQIVVLITSPDNPTGHVWSLDDLQLVANACREVGAILIVDHCFALSGIHMPRKLPMIWDLPPEICDWLAVWDTGKTIDISGEKLGFILSSNAKLSFALDQVLGMIQFSPSRLSLAVFRALFSTENIGTYISRLGDACRRNLVELAGCLPDRAVIHPAVGGSLAWIDLSSSLMSGGQLCEMWQRGGVSSVSGEIFFPRSPKPEVFMRVALARTESYFERALSLVRNEGHHEMRKALLASRVGGLLTPNPGEAPTAVVKIECKKTSPM